MGTKKPRINPRTAGFSLVLGALVFLAASCDTGSDDTGPITGTWLASFGDNYTITASTISYDDNYDDPEYEMSFTGIIEDHTAFTQSAGIIYFKYTVPNETDLLNKYNALYWKSLTSSTVELSIATSADYSNPAVATLEEAKTKFTLNNTGDWVTIWGGPYTKQ
ncbi:MAG: hypothetical protein LBD13_01550 [Spirochaetaceae bacterium]|jgi:hypothetical protein|nr:hypothetical protein [Spirochaetaceae bacterium]